MISRSIGYAWPTRRIENRSLATNFAETRMVQRIQVEYLPLKILLNHPMCLLEPYQGRWHGLVYDFEVFVSENITTYENRQ